jgi:hypothetical protein
MDTGAIERLGELMAESHAQEASITTPVADRGVEQEPLRTDRDQERDRDADELTREPHPDERENDRDRDNDLGFGFGIE